VVVQPCSLNCQGREHPVLRWEKRRNIFGFYIKGWRFVGIRGHSKRSEEIDASIAKLV